MNKLFHIIVVLAVLLTAFEGCKKDSSFAAEEKIVSVEGKLLFDENDLNYSKSVTIYDEIKSNSVKLLISSNSEELIGYYTEKYDFELVIDPIYSNANSITKEHGEVDGISNGAKKENPEFCITFEIIEQNFKSADSHYTLKFITKKETLKSYPWPPSHYAFVKFDKRKNGKFWYFPDDTTDDEIIYQWGYTNSWLGRWYEVSDSSFWLYGWDASSGPEVFYHPYNDQGYYRLGFSLYYEDDQYVHPISY